MNSYSFNRNGGFGNQGPQAPNLLDMFTGLVGGLLGGGGLPKDISISLPFREAPREEEQPGKTKRPGNIGGRQEDYLDPGFIGSMGLGTAIPLPQYDGVGDSDAIIKPKPMPDRYAGEAHNWLATGEPLRPHDWLQRDEPVHPFYKNQPQSPSPENSSGPAKASQFRDPRTGKFDYWGWLDAGMANLGKGGVLFEDDTPDVNAREGILDKPAAMTAAGAPENSRMPEESRFEARNADHGYDLGRTVAYTAQDGGGGGDAPAEGGGAGAGGDAGQAQAQNQGTPAQTQGPAQQPDGAGNPGQGQPQQGQGSSPDFKYRPWRDPKNPNTAQMIDWVAKYHGLDPKLFQRVIQIESEYDPGKVSPKGARGMGQLMPDTANRVLKNTAK